MAKNGEFWPFKLDNFIFFFFKLHLIWTYSVLLQKLILINTCWLKNSKGAKTFCIHIFFNEGILIEFI